MATTAASQAAPPAHPSSGGRGSAEQAYEAIRARRRFQMQIVAHLLFVVSGFLVALYLHDWNVVRPAVVRGLVVGAVLGAIFAWLVPWLVQDKKTAPYVFVSPFFILFFTFGVFPILFSLFLSFQFWDPTTGVEGMKFAGFEKVNGFPVPVNYYDAFTDKDFVAWQRGAAWNTFVIAVLSGVPQHLVGMPLAYFFHTSYKRLRNVITGAYFLPFITSSVAIALIFSSLFSKDFGVINAALDSLARIPGMGWIPHGENHIHWLGKAENVKPAISFVVWWRYLGWNTVLYLSALQAIPNDLFEAAEMDGASRWQTFSRVVLPLLRPMMLFAVTLTIIGNFQLFEEPFIITGERGGIESSGMTAAMYMYRYMNQFEYGIASAISWILFVVIAFLTWLNQMIFSRQRGAEGVA